MTPLLLRYPLESVAASYLTALLAYIVESGLGLLLGDQHWIRALVAPTFILPIAAGALAACVMGKRLSKASYFVGIIPIVLLLRALAEVIHAPYATHAEVWNTMAGTDCSSSECLYEAFFSVPFATAIAYSIAAVVIQARRSTFIRSSRSRRWERPRR